MTTRSTLSFVSCDIPVTQSSPRRSNLVIGGNCCPGLRLVQVRKKRLRARAVSTLAPLREFVYPLSMSDKPSKLKIADREFTSRLLVGTGKFASNELMRDALIASGTELVTVALRRADISGKHDPFANILDFIDPKRFCSCRTQAARATLRKLCAWHGSPRRGLAKMGQARDSSGPALSAARSCGDAGGRGNSGQGGIHGSALHQCRSGAGETIAGRRDRDGDAARFANRL